MRLQAETITVSLAELDDALVSARGEPDSVKKLVLDKIQQAFDEADLSFSDGALLVEDNLVNQTVEDGCTSTVINQMRTVVEVAADSALSLQLDSLFEPVTVQVELNTILGSTRYWMLTVPRGRLSVSDSVAVSSWRVTPSRSLPTARFPCDCQ